jgi:transcriptional regulator with XRE-family HTH domain
MKTSYSVHQLRHLRRTIGQNIHAARTRRQFTLSKLAKTSGVPEWRIDQYELGKNEIGLDDMLRLSAALGVHLPALITL